MKWSCHPIECGVNSLLLITSVHSFNLPAEIVFTQPINPPPFSEYESIQLLTGADSIYFTKAETLLL